MCSIRSTCLLLILTVNASMSAAQQVRPPSGITIDETRTVSLPSDLPARCVSLETGGATVVLDRDDIESAAAFSASTKWKSEEERLAFIAGSRAREMLAHLTDSKDATGCFRLSPLGNSEAIYLVGQLIENGKVAIYIGQHNTLLKSIQVRYSGFRGGLTFGRGEISFSIGTGTRPFFVMNWWTS
jgi:hypothetical protein